MILCKVVFELFQNLRLQIYASQMHDIINYSISICPLESVEKCGKEGKKLQKIEYLENEKSFVDEIKNIFHSFLKDYHLEKK